MVVEGDTARVLERSADVALSAGRLRGAGAPADRERQTTVGRHVRVVGEPGETGVELGRGTVGGELERGRARTHGRWLQAGVALVRVRREPRHRQPIRAVGVELGDAPDATRETREVGDRTAARRPTGHGDGRTRARKPDRARRQIVHRAARLVRPAARLADGRIPFGVRAGDRVEILPVRDVRRHTRLGVRLGQVGVPAFLQRLRFGRMEFHDGFADRELTRPYGAGAREREIAVGQCHQLVDGGIADACDARRDPAAITDRVGAGAMREVRAGRGPPEVRGAVLVGAIAAAGLVGPTAGFVDASGKGRGSVRDLGGGLRIGAGPGELAFDDRLLAFREGLGFRLHEFESGFHDRALTFDEVGVGTRRKGDEHRDGEDERNHDAVATTGHGQFSFSRTW